MTITHVPLRRLVTTLGVVAALVLGFGSIKAAASWTAASAPLSVAPVSISALQDRIAFEEARSQALVEQLTALTAQTSDLTAALEAAQARIGTDATTAAKLTKDLKAAKARLAKLQATIKAANAASARRAAATATATSRPTDTSGHGGADDEHDDG